MSILSVPCLYGCLLSRLFFSLFSDVFVFVVLTFSFYVLSLGLLSTVLCVQASPVSLVRFSSPVTLVYSISLITSCVYLSP